MDIEIIVLTTIVVSLFGVFSIATYREFRVMEDTKYKHSVKQGPRGALVDFVGNLVNDQKLTKKDKYTIYCAMRRNIADMESDGVYFDESIKELMKEKRDELLCEYSGLPSIKAYEESL